jgi:hypothetical protein
MKRLLLVAFLPLLLAASPAPYLTVSPSPTYVGDKLTFSGCGYGANKDYSITMHDPTGYTYGISTRADSGGCITTGDYWTYSPEVAGTYEMYVTPKTGSGVSDYGKHHAIVDFDFTVT